jgi:hypothetical protein
MTLLQNDVGIVFLLSFVRVIIPLQIPKDMLWSLKDLQDTLKGVVHVSSFWHEQYP